MSLHSIPLNKAISTLNLADVKRLLADGADVNFIDPELGPPITQICDQLFDWWQAIMDGYEHNMPLRDAEKTARLQPYLDIINVLIEHGANLHLWDAEEFFGPLWDAASAACVPVVQLLLDKGVKTDTLDDDNMTILSSISHLWFDVDFDEIDWADALPEEEATLKALRVHGAKMTKELATSAS